MGQKISPHGFRVGVIKDWDSKWYADKKDFSTYLIEDKKVRDYVKEKAVPRRNLKGADRQSCK